MPKSNQTQNSRKFLYEGKVPAELYATTIQINFDVANKKARVIFNGTPMTLVNGVVIPLPSNFDILETDISEMEDRCMGVGEDPVTGADLSKISLKGLERIISAVYDTLHNERAAEIKAQLEVLEHLGE